MIVNIIFTKGQGSFLAPFPCLSVKALYEDVCDSSLFEKTRDYRFVL